MNGEFDLFTAVLVHIMLGCALFVAGAIITIMIHKGDAELKMPRCLSDAWNRAKFLGQGYTGHSVAEPEKRPFQGPMGLSQLTPFIETLRYELRYRISAVETAPAEAVSTHYLPASVRITDSEFENLVDIVDIETEVTRRLAVAAGINFRKRAVPAELLRIHNVALSSFRGLHAVTIDANIAYSIVPDPAARASSETSSPEGIVFVGPDTQSPSSQKKTPKRTGRLLAIYGEKDV